MSTPFMQEQMRIVINIAHQHCAGFDNADELTQWLLDGFINEMSNNHMNIDVQSMKEALHPFFSQVSQMVWSKQLSEEQMIEQLFDAPKNSMPKTLSQETVLLNYRSIAQDVASLKSHQQERDDIKAHLKEVLDNEICENYSQPHIPLECIKAAREELEQWVDGVFSASVSSDFNIDEHVNEQKMAHILHLNSLM